MAKVLITGGAGFIGSQLGFYLDKKGHDVYLLDNMKYGYNDNLEIEGRRFGTFIDFDIRQKDFDKYTDGMDYVVHLAGLSSLPLCQSEPMYAMDVNVGGTANVLEACRISGVKRIIFASTGAIYENNIEVPFREGITVNPYLIYPVSKYQSESLCESYELCYGMDITILRFFNVYGKHQDFKRRQPPFTGYLLKQFMNNEDINLFSNGEQSRDYVHINDLTKLIEICLTHKNSVNSTFNACSGQAYSVNQIANTMMNLFGINVQINYTDPKTYWDNHPILHDGIYPIRKSIVEQEVNKYALGDTSKTKELLGWEAEVTLEEGLKDLVEYAKEIS